MKVMLIMLFIFFSPVQSNLWDNIFSEMQAKTPILLKSSLNFKFPLQYEGIEFEGQFDYNLNLQLVTLKVSKSLFVVSLDVFVLEINLKTFLITVLQLTQCERYKLDLFEDSRISKEDVEKIIEKPFSKIYLLNVLFKYEGKEKGLIKYVFQPDLLTGHTQSHEYEQNILVLVDKDGRIVGIYDKDGKNRKQIPFELTSSVKSGIPCTKKVQTITRKDLEEVITDFLKNQKQIPIPDPFN